MGSVAFFGLNFGALSVNAAPPEYRYKYRGLDELDETQSPLRGPVADGGFRASVAGRGQRYCA
jgi:hypothetical protein